ncbi:DUF7521 family protein [Haloarcula brevis]|uniref:DUF7521 family protein n=1 Tax=Haloarcula brevis TaxID=3111453 RepID=UPI00300E790D
MHPLQVNPSLIPSYYLVLLLVVLLAVAMGLFLVYQAYQGYRRNERRQMLFLAVGLALITVVSPLTTLVVSSIGLSLEVDLIVYTFYTPLLSNVIEIVGIGSIIYSLSLRSRS